MLSELEKQEIIQLLKDNLTVEISTDREYSSDSSYLELTVVVRVADEIISKSWASARLGD